MPRVKPDYELIAQWRRAVGLTQDQAAKTLGIKTRQYQRLESGDSSVKAKYWEIALRRMMDD